MIWLRNFWYFGNWLVAEERWSLARSGRRRRMAFFCLKGLFSFSIMQIRSVMTLHCLQLKVVKYWINDTSGNIKAVFLKLGTTNVHHKRTKMTPLVLLPWQHFCCWCCLNRNWNSQFSLKNLYLFSFLTERDWSRKRCYGNSTKGVILCLLWCAFKMPSFKNTSFIQYCTTLSYKQYHWFIFHNRKTSISIAKTKRDISKRKTPFLCISQISTNYFSRHRHLKNTWR